MKLKSLFLVGCAAMAMTSCNSENETVDNGGNVAKNAIFNFSIALPKALETRADDTNPGTAQEQKINDVTLVLTYESGIPSFTKTYPVSAFNRNDNVYTLANPERVSPGSARLTVYVNNKGVPAAKTVETASATGLGNYASTKDNGNFFMSGESAKNCNIVPNKTTTADPVKVNRIAVKLDEITADQDPAAEGNQYTFTPSASTLKPATDMKITLTEYAYSNLNKKSNTLASPAKYYNANDFFNPFVEDQKENQWKATFATTVPMGQHLTYCFENAATPAPTKIYYKANVAVSGVESGANFYVHDNKLYKDFSALNAIFNDALTEAFKLTDKSPNSEFAEKIGAKKYTAGVCYYLSTIHAEGIERNNWYKLKVTGIKDLGLPEIDVPVSGEPTYLIFSVEVNPWNVWNKDIEL